MAIEHNEITSPIHYTHAGIECKEFTDDMEFTLGRAFKYLYRCEHKGSEKKDLEKAIEYLKDAKRNGFLAGNFISIRKFNDEQSYQFRRSFPPEIMTAMKNIIRLNNGHRYSQGVDLIDLTIDCIKNRGV